MPYISNIQQSTAKNQTGNWFMTPEGKVSKIINILNHCVVCYLKRVYTFFIFFIKIFFCHLFIFLFN